MTLAQVVCHLAAFAAAGSIAAARPWTNAEGKTLEAEYVSSDATTVTLKMQGREIPYPLAKLSQADRDFVAGQAAVAASRPAAATGVRSGVKIDARFFPVAQDAFKDRDRKTVLEAFKGGAYPDSNRGTPDEWLKRDEEKDVCRMYVPASYDGSTAYGLLLYINSGPSGEIPPQWRGVLDELKLIAVGADGVGNDQPMIRRVLRSMDALATVEKHYKIDPKRRVVTGCSGGGHMAMLTAAMYPEDFLGAISHAAQSYLPQEDTLGHFPGLVLRDFKRGARGKLKWIVVSGDKDFNYAEIQKTSRQWEEARLTYRFLDVPGMGHVNAAAGPMKEALQWVGL